MNGLTLPLFLDRVRPGQLTSNQMVSQSVVSVVLSNPKKVHAGNGQEKAQSEIHTPETEVGKI